MLARILRRRAVGTIGTRAGVPVDVDQWGWGCGFYPESEPGEHSNGSAPTFDEARADFEAAWRHFLPRRTEADFQKWRDHQTFTAWKYRMHDEGLPLPTQRPDGRARCFCGAAIDIPSVGRHVIEHHSTGQ
jgi:hypothetical protein